MKNISTYSQIDGQRYKLTFETGQQVISYGISYIQIVVWEMMYESKIIKTEYYYG